MTYFTFDSGKILTSTNAVSYYTNGLPFDSGGRLAVTNGTASPSTVQNGWPFESNGRIAVWNGGTVANFSNGLPFTSNGRLVGDTSGGIVSNTNGIPLTNAGVSFSEGLPVPTELLMASRLNQMGFQGYTGSDGVDTDSNTQISCYNQTGTGVTKVKLYFANWYATTTNEATGYNTITITSAIEYPAGTFQQVTFNTGATSAAITAGSLQASDEITLTATIPDDAQYWVRTYVSVTAGQKWVQGYQIQTTKSEAADFSTGVDKTMSGTITNATASATRRGYGPVGIKATGFSGTPVKRAWAFLGDSILMGSGDGNIDSVGNTGWAGRAMSGVFPCVNMAIAGTNAQNNVTANLTRRIAAMQAIGVTDVLVDYHNNDLSGTRTYAQIIADVEDITNGLQAAGLRVHYCTPLPYVTGTYLTAAGQTIYTTNSGYIPEGSCRYSQVSDWVRTNTQAADGVVDIQAVVAVNSSNVLTTNGGRWISGNGGVGASNVHLTTSGASTDASTNDGRHPNVTNTGSEYGGHYILKDAMTSYIGTLLT